VARKPESDRFEEVFAELRSLLRKYEAKLVLLGDAPGRYALETKVPYKGKPMYFGGVEIRKNYVSFHLMPVYVTPALLDGISTELRSRQQGKSCFNFTSVDSKLFKELSVLVKSGFDSFVKGGLA